jgi:hypothetical protein
MPTPTPTPTAAPHSCPGDPERRADPDPAAIPDFAAGEIVASLIDGLRVRQRPGVDAAVIATGLLPLNAEMQVIMGPFPVDDFGWYLVSDADPAEPQFERAGSRPATSPTRSCGRPDVPPRRCRSWWRWPPRRRRRGTDRDRRGRSRHPLDRPRSGGGSLLVRRVADAPGGDPVQTIRATVGSGIDRGTLQPQTFAALGVRGTAFVSVVSDCTWALVMLRVPERPGTCRPSRPGCGPTGRAAPRWPSRSRRRGRCTAPRCTGRGHRSGWSHHGGSSRASR